MRALTMHHRALRQLLSAVFTSLLLTATAALAQSQGQALLENYTPVTLEELANPPASDWLMWRGTPNHWAYSPLDQINRDNVDSLRLAWSWTMEPGKQETTPLVHDGIMFLPQACDFIEAVDATDGTPSMGISPSDCGSRGTAVLCEPQRHPLQGSVTHRDPRCLYSVAKRDQR